MFISKIVQYQENFAESNIRRNLETPSTLVEDEGIHISNYKRKISFKSDKQESYY